MNTSIEQKYLRGSGGKSQERLMEYVDQNDKEGRNQDRIFADACGEWGRKTAYSSLFEVCMLPYGVWNTF